MQTAANPASGRSTKSFRLPQDPRGLLQIKPGTLPPLCTISGFALRLIQMTDGEAAPEQRTIAVVKIDQMVRHRILLDGLIFGQQRPAKIGLAQPKAFEVEQAQLVDRIEPTQFTAEFEAVDDQRLAIDQVDMLGTQITMPLDDPPLATAGLQRFTVLVDVGQQTAMQLLDPLP